MTSGTLLGGKQGEPQKDVDQGIAEQNFISILKENHLQASNAPEQKKAEYKLDYKLYG